MHGNVCVVLLLMYQYHLWCHDHTGTLKCSSHCLWSGIISFDVVWHDSWLLLIKCIINCYSVHTAALYAKYNHMLTILDLLLLRNIVPALAACFAAPPTKCRLLCTAVNVCCSLPHDQYRVPIFSCITWQHQPMNEDTPAYSSQQYSEYSEFIEIYRHAFTIKHALLLYTALPVV